MTIATFYSRIQPPKKGSRVVISIFGTKIKLFFLIFGLPFGYMNEIKKKKKLSIP